MTEHTKAVIFDLDGTLLDTLTDLANSLNQALRQNGLPQHPHSAVRQFVGNGIATLVKRALPGGETHPLYETVLADIRQLYAIKCRENTAPYDGILPMLKELHEMGYKMAVVSNKPDAQVKKLCTDFFCGYIDIAIGQQEGVPLKPAPDSLLQTIEALGCPKTSCIYVGDSDVDILTARNADVRCVSVLWGFRDQDQLLSAGATHFIQNPAEMGQRIADFFVY